MKKTNAMRILEAKKIAFSVQEYDDNTEHELSHGAAGKTAEKLGISPECVFKTIVMRTDTKEICVFCQSAVYEINLKKARTACGAKEIAPVKPEELLALTGYVRGGCSPVGMKRQFRTFIDKSALLHEKIHISAGVRGEQIELAPGDLISVTGATICDLVL